MKYEIRNTKLKRTRRLNSRRFRNASQISCFYIRNHKQHILSHYQFNFTINAYKENTVCALQKNIWESMFVIFVKLLFESVVYSYYEGIVIVFCYCHYCCLYITQFHDVIGFINILYENRISDFLFTHSRNDNWLIDYN